MERSLSNEEIEVVAALKTHPGWGVFERVFEDRVRAEADKILGGEELSPSEAYNSYRRLRALQEVKNDLLSFVSRAVEERDSLMGLSKML